MSTPEVRERRIRNRLSWIVAAVSVAMTVGLSTYLYESQHVFHEAELRGDLFATIVNNASVPFLVITEEGLITEWNPAAEKVLGWKRSEVLGSDLIFLMADSSLQYKHAEIWSSGKLTDRLHGQSLRVKCWINRKDDEPIEAYLELNEISLDYTQLYTAEIRPVAHLLELDLPDLPPGDLRGDPVQRPDFDIQQSLENMLR